MVIRYASWVHGNAFLAQDVNQDVDGRSWTAITGARFNHGVEYQIEPGGDWNRLRWFHAPVPTPVYLNNEWLFLEKAFVLFKTDGTVVARVQVWDANQLMWDANQPIPGGPFIPFQADEYGGGQSGDFSLLRTDPGGLRGGAAPVRAFSNTFLPRKPDGHMFHPAFGVGITVGVRATPVANRTCKITFIGAGADFKQEHDA